MSVFGMGFDAIKAGFVKPELHDIHGKPIQIKAPDPTAEAPAADPKEIGVSQDMAILDDEKAGLLREDQGREAEYNPNWETPVSELMEIPEMPEIPKFKSK